MARESPEGRQVFLSTLVAGRKEDFQSRVPSEKWSCARRSSQDARDELDEGPLADDVIRNGLAWLQRNSSVTPA